MTGERGRRRAPRVEPARLAGVDIARGLAVLGMFAAHTLTRASETETLVDGRSSVLFATLAGVSLGLITGGANPVVGLPRIQRIGSIAIRALLLIALGLALWVPRTDIAVILDYYGVMFLLLLPVLFAPRWALAVVAVLAAVGAPLLVAPAASLGLDPVIARFSTDWLLTGYYPALIWVAYLAAGLIAARSDLGARRTQLALLVGGGGLALIGYGAARAIPGATAEAHSNSTFEVLGSGGVALALLGALLLVTSTEAGAVGTGIRRLLWPVAATGAMPLTVYVAQLAVLAVWIQVQGGGSLIEYPAWFFAALALGAIAFASLWRATLGAGPLERLLRRASGLASPRSR